MVAVCLLCEVKGQLHRALSVCRYSAHVKLLKDLMVFSPLKLKKKKTKKSGNYQELYVVHLFLNFLAFPRWPYIPTMPAVRQAVQ